MNSITTKTAYPFITALPPELVPLLLIQEEVKWLILITAYTAFLVPIAVVLFFFSTPQLRRRPVFILNVCTLVIGIGQGFICASTSVNTMLMNISATPRPAIASICLFICVPFFVQGILILRVLAAYPPRTLSYARTLAIYGPIVLFKLARAGNMAYLIFHLSQVINEAGGLSSNTIFTVSEAVWTFPSTKAEWFLQLFDDMYVSTLFIMKLRKRAGVQGKASGANVLRTIPCQVTFLHQPLLVRCTYIQRLKTLFWTAVFNFVVPIIFNIVLIILVFREPDFLHGSYIIYTNNYAQIIGVLLATVFVAGRQGDHRLQDDGLVKQLGHSPGEFMYTTCVELQSVGEGSS